MAKELQDFVLAAPRTAKEVGQHFGHKSRFVTLKEISALGLDNLVDFSGMMSKINVYWQRLLNHEFPFIFSIEGRIFGDRRQCDFYSLQEKIAIDINPSVTHTIDNAHPYWSPKTKIHHQKRSLDALKQGWLLIQIFDWHSEELALKKITRILNGEVSNKSMESLNFPTRRLLSKEDRHIIAPQCRTVIDNDNNSLRVYDAGMVHWYN